MSNFYRHINLHKGSIQLKPEFCSSSTVSSAESSNEDMEYDEDDREDEGDMEETADDMDLEETTDTTAVDNLKETLLSILHPITYKYSSLDLALHQHNQKVKSIQRYLEDQKKLIKSKLAKLAPDEKKAQVIVDSVDMSNIEPIIASGLQLEKLIRENFEQKKVERISIKGKKKTWPANYR